MTLASVLESTRANLLRTETSRLVPCPLFRSPLKRGNLTPVRSTCCKNSPLYQLQVLFAFLQSSKQAVYDPTPLVNSLKLDQTEQQDAQEFSKLFLSLLDHEFKKQGSKVEQDSASSNVGKLVQEQVSRARV